MLHFTLVSHWLILSISINLHTFFFNKVIDIVNYLKQVMLADVTPNPSHNIIFGYNIMHF